MPGQHGQTYDPQEEPAPRGGWFRLEERPFPERADRVSKWVSAGAAAAGGVALLWLVLGYGTRPPTDAAGYAWLVAATGIAAAMAYGFTRGIGMIVVSAYGAARDGPELVVDWRALRHDIRLRRTRVVLLEGALLLAAAGISVWGLVLAVREGSAFGGAVCAVVQAMTWWPYIRRWMLTGRAD